MFGWLRRGPARPDTALAMIGSRASDDVLFLGARDPSVAAENGTITRLNGHTVVAGHGSVEKARVEDAAGKAGAILEFVDAPLTALPFAANTFHIVVMQDLAVGSAEAMSVVAEAVRVLQPGGRIILIVGEPARGPLAAFNTPPAPDVDVMVMLLTRAGLVATRRLAEAEGVTYFEGRKGRD